MARKRGVGGAKGAGRGKGKAASAKGKGTSGKGKAASAKGKSAAKGKSGASGKVVQNKAGTRHTLRSAETGRFVKKSNGGTDGTGPRGK